MPSMSETIFPFYDSYVFMHKYLSQLPTQAPSYLIRCAGRIPLALVCRASDMTVKPHEGHHHAEDISCHSSNRSMPGRAQNRMVGFGGRHSQENMIFKACSRTSSGMCSGLGICKAETAQISALRHLAQRTQTGKLWGGGLLPVQARHVSEPCPPMISIVPTVSIEHPLPPPAPCLVKALVAS